MELFQIRDRKRNWQIHTSKVLSTNKALPWVTGSIKRLIKKRDRLNKKCRDKKKQNGLIPPDLEEKMTEGAFMLNFWGQNQRFQTWLEQNAVASMLIFE